MQLADIPSGVFLPIMTKTKKTPFTNINQLLPGDDDDDRENSGIFVKIVKMETKTDKNCGQNKNDEDANYENDEDKTSKTRNTAIQHSKN